MRSKPSPGKAVGECCPPEARIRNSRSERQRYQPCQRVLRRGLRTFDALHLACAEAAGADVLLTTDDGFMRKASRGNGDPRVAVRNPLAWSQENLP